MFRRNHITAPGMIFLGITTFVMVAALNSGTNLLYLAFGLMLGAFLASAFLSRLSLKQIDVRRVMTDHVVTGEPAIIQYQLTNRKRFWPCFAIRIAETNIDSHLSEAPQGYCMHIAPGKSANILARLVASRRGLVALTDIRLTCSFPFGFVSRTVLLHRPEPLVVYPRIGTLNRHLALRCRESTETGTMTSSVRRGNDEFYGLREYRAGDNIRSIHWRSTARTGQLTIREMASNAPPQMVIVLDLRRWRDHPDALVGPDGPGQVERAIELAASLLCYAFLENFAVALAVAGSGSDVPPIPQMGREARATLLHRLAILDPQKLDDHSAIPIPNRLAGRAEWVIISLRRDDPMRDLLPSSARHTQLALDSPEAATWVHFLSGHETLRILRESQPAHASIVPNAATR